MLFRSNPESERRVGPCGDAPRAPTQRPGFWERERSSAPGPGILAQKRKISGVGGQSPHPRNVLLPILHAETIYCNSAFGTRSPSRIAKRCNAAFQFCTGMVHFFAMCSRARYPRTLIQKQHRQGTIGLRTDHRSRGAQLEGRA